MSVIAVLRRKRREIGRLVPTLNANVGAASGFTALADIVAAVMSLLAAVVTSRLLGADGRGEMAAATTICGLAYMLGTLGLGTANTFYAARKTIPYDVLLGNSFAAGIGLGICTAVITVGIGMVFPGIFGDLDRNLIYLGVSIFPLSFTELFLSYIINGKKLFFAGNVMSMFARIFALVLVILISAVHPVVLFVFAMFQSFSIIRLVMNLIYMRRVGLLVRPRVDIKSFMLSIAYATKARGADMFAYLNLRFDVFVLNYFTQPAAVGVYSIGVLISEFSWYPSVAINKVIFPHIADDEVNIDEATNRAIIWCRISLLVTSILSIMIVSVGWAVVPRVFGVEFSGARMVIVLLIPGALLYSVTRVLSTSLAAMELPHLASLIAAATFVGTLCLDILLIPRYGINGAATASSMSYMVSALLSMGIFAHKTGATFWAGVAIGRREVSELIRAGRSMMSALR